MNQHIAIKLTRMMIEVLRDKPPVIPPRGVPLPSVLTTKPRKPKEERRRYVAWRIRRGLSVHSSDEDRWGTLGLAMAGDEEW